MYKLTNPTIERLVEDYKNGMEESNILKKYGIKQLQLNKLILPRITKGLKVKRLFQL